MSEILQFGKMLLFGTVRQRFDAAKYISDYVAMITRVAFIFVIYTFWDRAMKDHAPANRLEPFLDWLVRGILLGLGMVLLLAMMSITLGIADQVSKQKNPLRGRLRFLAWFGRQMLALAITLLFSMAAFLAILGALQAIHKF